MNAMVRPSVLDRVALHGVHLLGDAHMRNAARAYSLPLQVAKIAMPDGPPLWRREDVGARYRSASSLHLSDAGYVLSIDCEGQGRFLVTDKRITVDWQGGTSHVHYLQTLALSLFLELNSVPCVHANALAIDEHHAIGLLAPSRGGKSTLSHALVQAGASLMTDDMLALHDAKTDCTVYPARPVLRLWPDAVRSIASVDEAALPRVHARFAKRELTFMEQEQVAETPRKLAALFVLDRRVEEDGSDSADSSAIELEPIAGSAALVHLLQQSMLADAYASLGLEGERVSTLSQVLESVSVYRLGYPSGTQHLRMVSEKLLAFSRK